MKNHSKCSPLKPSDAARMHYKGRVRRALTSLFLGMVALAAFAARQEWWSAIAIVPLLGLCVMGYVMSLKDAPARIALIDFAARAHEDVRRNVCTQEERDGLEIGDYATFCANEVNVCVRVIGKDLGAWVGLVITDRQRFDDRIQYGNLIYFRNRNIRTRTAMAPVRRRVAELMSEES